MADRDYLKSLFEAAVIAVIRASENSNDGSWQRARKEEKDDALNELFLTLCPDEDDD